MLSREERQKNQDVCSLNMPKGKSKWFYINKAKKKQKAKRSAAAKKGSQKRKRKKR